MRGYLTTDHFLPPWFLRKGGQISPWFINRILYMSYEYYVRYTMLSCWLYCFQIHLLLDMFVNKFLLYTTQVILAFLYHWVLFSYSYTVPRRQWAHAGIALHRCRIVILDVGVNVLQSYLRIYSFAPITVIVQTSLPEDLYSVFILYSIVTVVVEIL